MNADNPEVWLNVALQSGDVTKAPRVPEDYSGVLFVDSHFNTNKGGCTVVRARFYKNGSPLPFNHYVGFRNARGQTQDAFHKVVAEARDVYGLTEIICGEVRVSGYWYQSDSGMPLYPLPD